MRGNGHRRQRDYAWVCAIDKVTERPVVDGPYNNENEANQFGYSRNINGGDFEVHTFPTRNKIAARDMFKHKVLERTGDISSVFKRAMYPKN